MIMRSGFWFLVFGIWFLFNLISLKYFVIIVSCSAVTLLACTFGCLFSASSAFTCTISKLFFRAVFASFSRYQTPSRFIRYAVVAASNLVKDSAQIAQEDLDLDATFKVCSAPVHFSFNFPVCLCLNLQPNALNSVMFLIAMSIQNITFAMNYQVIHIPLYLLYNVLILVPCFFPSLVSMLL